MIKRQTAFVVGDKVFATLAQAQEEALLQLSSENPGKFKEEGIGYWIKLIVENKERVVDILTTTESSLTAARKINGGRKPRKPKKPEIVYGSETAA